MKNYYVILSKTSNQIRTDIINVNLFGDTLRDEVVSKIESLPVAPTEAYELEASKAYLLTSTDNINNDHQSTFDNDFVTKMRRWGCRVCDECHNWIFVQDIQSSVYDGNANKRLCKTCYDKSVAVMNARPRPKMQNIFDYHGYGSFKFLQSRTEHMTEDDFIGGGFEMEWDKSGGKDYSVLDEYETTDEFYEFNRGPRGGDNGRVYCSHDGSLSRGFEIISHVFSEKYFDETNWAPLFNEMKRLGAEDNKSSSGFHFHLSKRFLGEDRKTQALNLLKLHYFLSTYADDFKRISGRDLFNSDAFYYCGFADPELVATMKNEILNCDESRDPFSVFQRNGRASHCGGSSAYLIPSGNTIEFRFFKSTSDIEKFTHVIKLCFGLVKQISKVPFEKVFCLGKVLKQVPQPTLNYFRKNGAFLRTVAIDNKGVSL